MVCAYFLYQEHSKAKPIVSLEKPGIEPATLVYKA